jgi:hypothetical protein
MGASVKDALCRVSACTFRRCSQSNLYLTLRRKKWQSGRTMSSLCRISPAAQRRARSHENGLSQSGEVGPLQEIHSSFGDDRLSGGGLEQQRAAARMLVCIVNFKNRRLRIGGPELPAAGRIRGSERGEGLEDRHRGGSGGQELASLVVGIEAAAVNIDTGRFLRHRAAIELDPRIWMALPIRPFNWGALATLGSKEALMIIADPLKAPGKAVHTGRLAAKPFRFANGNLGCGNLGAKVVTMRQSSLGSIDPMPSRES